MLTTSPLKAVIPPVLIALLHSQLLFAQAGTEGSEEEALSAEKATRAQEERSKPSMLPINTVNPMVARRAFPRGIEGSCMLSFTVTEKGTVDPDSIRIVDEAPTRIIENTCIAAARKLKYSPTMENGRAVETKLVEHTFTFEFFEE